MVLSLDKRVKIGSPNAQTRVIALVLAVSPSRVADVDENSDIPGQGSGPASVLER